MHKLVSTRMHYTIHSISIHDPNTSHIPQTDKEKAHANVQTFPICNIVVVISIVGVENASNTLGKQCWERFHGYNQTDQVYKSSESVNREIKQRLRRRQRCFKIFIDFIKTSSRIIPEHSTCKKCANHLTTKLVGTLIKLRKRRKKNHRRVFTSVPKL